LKAGEPLTITGLAIALETSRETLMNYEKKDEFFDAVKSIKLVCENYAERALLGKNPTGPIFALKNYGWRDKREIEHTGDLPFNLTIVQRNERRDTSLLFLWSRHSGATRCHESIYRRILV
jgi:hypothetical protein